MDVDDTQHKNTEKIKKRQEKLLIKTSRASLQNKNKKNNWFAKFKQKFKESAVFATDERMKKYEEA